MAVSALAVRWAEQMDDNSSTVIEGATLYGEAGIPERLESYYHCLIPQYQSIFCPDFDVVVPRQSSTTAQQVDLVDPFAECENRVDDHLALLHRPQEDTMMDEARFMAPPLVVRSVEVEKVRFGKGDILFDDETCDDDLVSAEPITRRTIEVLHVEFVGRAKPTF